MPYADPEAKRAHDAARYAEAKQDPTRLAKWRKQQREGLQRARMDPERRALDSLRTREWARRNPEKARALQIRNNLRKYGLTPDAYRAIFDAQGGTCAICHEKGAPFGSGTRTDVLAVDHDHKTGKVRGLLCMQCNQMIGKARERLDVLASAVAYLQGAG